MFLDDQDVTEAIRSPRISEQSSLLARIGPVRADMVARQQRIGTELGSLVTEGRDQGTVVFPHAEFKFYLDASPAVRARRRCDELLARGQQADFDDVLRQIVARDEADSTRRVGPLCRPPDAIVLDTSEMTIDQVAEWLAARGESAVRNRGRL